MASENQSTAEPIWSANAIPGISVCKICDASSVHQNQWGKPVDGDICLGCGRQTYELLRVGDDPS